MYNIGIIGTSKISQQKLIPAINKSKYVSFWSIFSNDYDRAVSFSQKFNACGYVIVKCCEMFFVEMNEQSASNA